MKEIDDLYYYLGRLEEDHCAEFLNPQQYLARQDARMRLEVAISDVAELLTQLSSQKENREKT